MAAWRIYIFTMFFTLLPGLQVLAQIPCSSPGKTPSTALPVCGNGVTRYASFEICGGQKIGSSACGGFYDDGPAYFKFTCNKSGTLGFVITPIQMSDYDWAVFDITGIVPEAIFTVPDLAIASNLSGEIGPTGAGPEGQSLHECSGPTYPTFSKMPDLVANHQYLLLVSNWIEVASIFSLEFKWGTADIGNHEPVEAKELIAACDGLRFMVTLSKKVTCSSIAADGSDFQFEDESIKIASAFGAGCSANFDTDTIIVMLEKALPPGQYSLRSKRGTDGNTLMDSCDNLLEPDQILSTKVPAPVPAPLMDSVVSLGCLPMSMDLVMKSFVLCTSIARDGSDFEIKGPGQVKVKMAAPATICNGDSSRLVRLYLQDPIVTGGKYSLSVKRGSDGNTLQNTCYAESPPGQAIKFTAYSKVSAGFITRVARGCTNDTVRFEHPGGNEINAWIWQENNGPAVATERSLMRIYPNAMNTFSLSMWLKVSNSVCTDSASFPLFLPDIRVNAAFEAPRAICPEDSFELVNKSSGPVISWLWDLGGGRTSNLQIPPVQYYRDFGGRSPVTMKLTVGNEIGCSHSYRQLLEIYSNCTPEIPAAFTPNADGLNDYLYPLNAWKTAGLHFEVYNYFGQPVWATTDPYRKWDGYFNGHKAPAGTYVWVLKYTETNTGKRIVKKGTTILIR